MKSVQAIFYNNPDYYPPIINGLRVMDAAGMSVDLIGRDYGSRWSVDYPPTARIHRVAGLGHKSSWREYTSFVKTVLSRANREANVFIGHDMHGLLPARILATRHKRPLIYHCHDFADDTMSLAIGGRIVRWFERCFARTADLVIIPDASRATLVANALHLQQPPMIVANAPLNPPSLDEGLLSRTLKERGYDLSKVLFRQGRVGPGHAIEVTLRSMSHWSDDGWGFVVMGFAEPEYLSYLDQLSQEQGMGKRFVYLPAVGYDEVAKFTVGAHSGHAIYEPIHINNRYIATASNKIMEYMASGLPIIASDQPDIRCLLEEHSCGVVADATSPEAIAGAVNSVFGSDQYAALLGNSGRQSFKQKFNYRMQFASVIEWIKLHT